MKRMAALGLVMALSASAANISLSGIVKDSVTGNGLSGVKVSLAKGGLSPTTTLSNGSWTLSGVVTGIAGRHGTTAVSGTSQLSVQDGHVLLRYEGHDLLGHSQPVASVATASAASLARSSASVVDTLLVSWKDSIRVRYPLTSYSTSNLVLAFDTSSIVLDTGHFTDARDGQTYKYTKIGSQTWMAQNLNYRNTTGKSDTVGVCYGHLSSNCTTYGRLYTWSEVMNGSASSTATPSGVLGICPSGWHVPSDGEWSTLVQYVDSTTSGTKLKANSSLWGTNTGTDVYGFSVLPAGRRYGNGTFLDLGCYADFWSSSENDASIAWYRYFSYAYAYVYRIGDGKTFGFSLRCLQN